MPVVISKELFYEKISKELDCRVIHYWTDNCVQGALPALPQVAIGVAKFFLPIYLLRMAIDYRRKKKNILKTFVIRELRSILYGASLSLIIISSICLLGKICGRIHYYNLLLIPGFLSGLGILVESDENQTLDTLIFFNSFIETNLNALKVNTTKQAILFVIFSGILMQLFENRKEELNFNYWWFYTPPLKKISNDNHQNKCSHENSCRFFITNGVKNYFMLGAGINITKRLLGSFKLLIKSPAKLVNVVFHKSNVYFGLLIAAYVGIYRAITCYLRQTQLLSEKWHGLLAGAISGVPYCFYPTIQLPVLAITTTLQIFYHNLCKHYNITNHFYQRLLLYQCVHACNLHTNFFYPNISSPYYSKMVDACTNRLTSKIYDQLVEKYFL
ncbi:transmembrane protein 135-like [Diabrotica virgifera virgifera]|uniref:Transmembrane protein 135-like isoform X1 n=2 Tax=Diabrotica virgifera virgifera TaxID=50390 RepID=A0A6P7EZV0_DIAVI|nr:transmembrane protein 135-like [Diabrotica virgifera virgifera]